jgi:hypothetical protein
MSRAVELALSANRHVRATRPDFARGWYTMHSCSASCGLSGRQDTRLAVRRQRISKVAGAQQYVGSDTGHGSNSLGARPPCAPGLSRVHHELYYTITWVCFL